MTVRRDHNYGVRQSSITCHRTRRGPNRIGKLELVEDNRKRRKYSKDDHSIPAMQKWGNKTINGVRSTKA